MWRRPDVPGDQDVARQMGRALKRLPADVRRNPVAVAEMYGQLMFSGAQRRRPRFLAERNLRGKHFDVAMGEGDFGGLVQRSAWISESLILSHGTNAPYRHLGKVHTQTVYTDPDTLQCDGSDERTVHYGMHCPDLSALGSWVIEHEPMIRAGLCWYLPRYSTRSEFSSQYKGQTNRSSFDRAPMEQITVVDYVLRGGRLIDSSGSEPSQHPLVRTALQVDLPSVQGVNPRDFSSIMSEEFRGHKQFKYFLRSFLLSMSAALNAEQSQSEINKLRPGFDDRISALRVDIDSAVRSGPLAAAGARATSTAALLVAVASSVADPVLRSLGPASPETFWQSIRERVESGPHGAHNGTWRYVWILDRKSGALR
ncbi:hypothetical protein [Streptomyces sp. NPDC048590]|uniref:hypothetical protein n=1 Tax=Streptomyces sp. NPDC048590 TaxID=3365574 RepID=UPI003712A99C